MKLADTIATHPKILRAGELLGTKDGAFPVLGLYVAALGYARHFLTNGFVPDSFLASNTRTGRGDLLAKILADPSVHLWHRVKGGYRIHDFHDWNDKASAIKEKRRVEKRRVAAYRAKKRNGAE